MPATYRRRIVGGQPGETRSRAARRRWREHAAWRTAWTFTGWLPPHGVAAPPRAAHVARAAQRPQHALRALHVAAQAIRIPRRGPSHRRVDPAGAARDPAPTDQRAARRARSRRRLCRGRSALLMDDPHLADRSGRARLRRRGAITAGIRAPQRLEPVLVEAARATRDLGALCWRWSAVLTAAATLADETATRSSARACGRRARAGPGYLDLRPSATFTEQTKYLDEALHADARHETVSPPLLQAGVRQWMLRRFLQPAPGRPDRRSRMRQRPIAGLEPRERRRTSSASTSRRISRWKRLNAAISCWATCGACRLPIGAFSKGYALDVFEHLSREALADVLGEIARVMRPGGHVFVYSHVRKNSWLAGGLKGVNALARGLERIGLVDLRQERLRKSRSPQSRLPTFPISSAPSATPGSASRESATTRRSSAPSSRTS